MDEELRAPFRCLESSYMQKKAYTSLGLVEPVQRELGQTLKRRGKRFKLCSEYAYDIPLEKSLQQLLSNSSIFDQVMSGHCQNDNLFEDYCDGSIFKNHLLFSVNPTALQVMLYYDDLEICNPIGSRAKKHKIGVFYYILGNIPPKWRSSLKVIQLVTIVRHSLIHEYGIDKILQPFMESIKKFEKAEGVDLNINGQQHNFRGTITIVCADNLASWSLGGYKALASALRKCRFCMAIAEDMSSKFLSEEFQPRTRITHANHVTHLAGPLHDHIATTYGIVRDSILNQSQFFHVTEGLAPDIMHDILEGALQYETKELLIYVTQERRLISLSFLNQQIESFPYGYCDSSNKPSIITLTSHDHSLKQSATQMWCLARLLPLLVGEFIPVGEPHWENFLLLLTIVEYVFGPVTSEDVVPYLKDLIREHHENFCQLYPNASIIPKIHYIIHLPEWLLNFGPASRYLCMRFEAKHSYFKSLAHRIKCFKNIEKTLAEHHQNLMCYYSICDYYVFREWTFGRTKLVLIVYCTCMFV
uniref:Uncharacterized protein n=1 Tax=Amphimedon queenslandica TaxID=400682 RepID=A0A1X7T9Z5_AMPQE